MLAAAVAIGAVTQTTAAHAEDTKPEAKSDYCQKVTARADADSALLFAPTASVQLIRYPQSAILDTLGVQVGRDVQPRGHLSIGFVDIYKGFGVKDVAAKDCERQAATVTLQEMILRRDDPARKVAIERKLAFLKDQQGKIEAVLREAEARFTAGTSTLIEVREVRMRALDVAVKTADAERVLAGIKAQEKSGSSESMEDVLRKYEESSTQYEKSVEHVRNLAPWKFGLTGGATAHPNVDYFGVAELSYNLGGLFSVGAESRATEARVRELKSARYELRHQADALRTEMRAQAEISRRQVGLIDAELARVNRERAAVEATDAPNKSHVVAALTLESIDLESERLFLSTLAEKQSAIGGQK